MLSRTMLVVSLVVLAAAPAQAGRGASYGAMRNAIWSGSADAIKAELERGETVVCPACVDLVMPLVDHEDASVRQVAAWWLSRRGVRTDVMNQMIARLSDVDSQKARNAADVLGEFQRVDAILPLGTALGNRTFSPEARVHVARALGTIGDVRAQPSLQQGLGAPEPEVRAAALAALRALRGFGSGEVAVPLLTDADESVRVQAIYTVGLVRSGAGVSALTGLLAGDASVNVRKKAAWALGEIGAAARSAAPALQAAASSDASPLVRSLAQAALGRLNR